MMTFQWIKKKHALALGAAFITVLGLNVALVRSIKKESNYRDRAERIAFLVDELTATPERQQRALDEIVKDEDGAFIYLLEHLDDRRSLADRDVLFLNTHPNSFEKYFHAGGARVDETILRYLCWKTRSCDVGFDLNNAAAVKIQREKVELFIQEKFIDPSR